MFSIFKSLNLNATIMSDTAHMMSLISQYFQSIERIAVDVCTQDFEYNVLSERIKIKKLDIFGLDPTKLNFDSNN